MTGDFLLKRLQELGYNKRSEIADLLGISEQNFNVKIKAQDIKVSFLLEVVKVTNKSVCDFIDAPDLISLDKKNTQPLEIELLKENRELRKKIEKLEADLDKVKSVSTPIAKSKHELK